MTARLKIKELKHVRLKRLYCCSLENKKLRLKEVDLPKAKLMEKLGIGPKSPQCKLYLSNVSKS